MNTTPLSDKDIECLRVQTSKVTRFGICIVMPLFSLITTIAGLLNLYYCSRFAELARMNMAEVIRTWFNGIDVTASYSGILLKALERWETAIIEFAAGGVVAALCVIGWRTNNLFGRILESIEHKNHDIERTAGLEKHQ